MGIDDAHRVEQAETERTRAEQIANAASRCAASGRPVQSRLPDQLGALTGGEARELAGDALTVTAAS